MSRDKEQDQHHHRLEIAPDLVNTLTKTFIQRTDCYPLQRENGAYVCIRQPISPSLIQAHLRGLVTVGAYALDRHSQAQWLCFDADQDPQWEALKTMSKSLAQEGITSYLETSRRGGHLWLFTDPLPGQMVRRFGTVLAEEYGLERIELYPRQDQLITGVGSLVRLPFGIHRKTGQRYPFITAEGNLLAPTLREQIRLLASVDRIPTNYIHDVTDQAAGQPAEVRPLRLDQPRSPQGKLASGETLSEYLKNAVTVYDFVSQYVQLDERGQGKCPFHDDHIKSFQVHGERNFWHCYAGCKGQTIIDFWMLWRAIDFKQAVIELRALLLK